MELYYQIGGGLLITALIYLSCKASAIKHKIINDAIKKKCIVCNVDKCDSDNQVDAV